jgi:putative addiction module killer protein
MKNPTLEILELKVGGKSLYAKWFKKLAVNQQAEVDARMDRVADGKLGTHRNLSGGLIELTFGSVLRVYGGIEDGKFFCIALGGDKRNQSEDIRYATQIWKAYTKGKKEKKHE